MRYLASMIFLIFASGCTIATTEITSPTVTASNLAASGKKSFTNVSKVYPGMTLSEVRAVVGDYVVVGYEASANNPQGAEPIKIRNPYREEAINVNFQDYIVRYYLANTVKADGEISDDELMPLVFQKDKVIGKGWDFLFKLKN